MEWELSKENVQPLREGRNVEKLNQALKAKVEGQTKSKISEQHRKMLEAIDNYQGEDPLRPWIECIEWVKEAYPFGGNQSGLLQLLELCARTFYKDNYYLNDIRYLKIWMEYADRCTHPQEIFSFLQDNNIGQNHALFYERYARFLEQQNKFSQANDIYQVGLARKVQPHDSLQIAYAGFIKRSVRESLTKDDTKSPTAQGRSFGNTIAGNSRGSVSHQKIRPQRDSKTDRSMAKQIPVFVDREFQSKGSNCTSTSSSFVGERERMKENMQSATKWAGVRIPQRNVHSVPAVELNVFTDEEFLHNMEQRSAKKRIPASRALRLDDIVHVTREADRLKQNPLAYFNDEEFELM